MTTLTMKSNMTIAQIISRTTPVPHVPYFMEGTIGGGAILVRDINEPFYTEHWLSTNVFIGGFEPANDAVLSAYFDDVPYIDFGDVAEAFSDIPEPISVHDQDVWLELFEGEHEEFVRDYAELAREYA